MDADYMRIRAWPFAHAIHDFVAAHERVYVVEQNRDAQLASLLKLDLPAEQVAKLRSILHYNGLPVDAESITEEFARQGGPLNGNRSLQLPKSITSAFPFSIIAAARARSAPAAATTPSPSASSTPSSRWAWSRSG